MHRLRETEAMLRQSEKLAQLGTLAAGIAHELNNPASAVKRGSEELRRAIYHILDIPARFRKLGLSPEQLQELDDRLLAAHGVADPSLYSGDIVAIGYGVEELEELSQRFSVGQLPEVVLLLCAAYMTEAVLAEISQGAGRMSDIVAAMKSYVYLDQAPIQKVDIHEGLNNTLIILKHKLKRGIVVRKEYAAKLTEVLAYGSELNQVWTNLIDNAADALDGEGEIVISTSTEGDTVTVEIKDDGPGIPDDAQPKIFTLFFTTKPVGKGSGQGLNISWNIVHRHGGSLTFRSRPGETVFSVELPVSFKGPEE